MTSKIFISTLLSAALISGSVGQASADIGDAIVGGIIGGVIVNEVQRNRARTPPRTVVVDTSARQQAREVQSALNHFYFNVGAPDGVLGPQSRAGISQYQSYLGFPMTGELTEFQRQVLISSYQRAQFGGPQVIQVSQSHPDGLRGLLRVVRDEMMGVPQTPSVTAAAPAPIAPAAPGTVAAGMPNFLSGGAQTQQVSLASHCNRVGLITSANGGYSDIGTLREPAFTLNEQFCLARSYAIADGEALMAQLGVSAQDVAGQCAGIGGALQVQIAALSQQPRDVVLANTLQWTQTSGMSPRDLATNARICLSSGYATDDMAVALGSALILTALGETAYGELPAHHLMQGIGAGQRQDLATEWYHASVPVTLTTEVAFQPGPAGRNQLILAAIDMANRGTATMPAPTAPATGK